MCVCEQIFISMSFCKQHCGAPDLGNMEHCEEISVNSNMPGGLVTDEIGLRMMLTLVATTMIFALVMEEVCWGDHCQL